MITTSSARPAARDVASTPTIQVVVQQSPAAHGRPRRRAAALALAAGGAALVSSGVFSAWDATAGIQSGQLSAGTGAATLLDANGGTFTTGVANLLPADYFHRYVDVQNGGSQASPFTGTVRVTGDLSGQLSVDAVTCSVPWTTVAGASTCTGTTRNIGNGTPTTATDVTVAHGTIGAGAADAQHVRYTFTFSGTAPSSMQGKTGSIAISVTGTVVGGTDRTIG